MKLLCWNYLDTHFILLSFVNVVDVVDYGVDLKFNFGFDWIFVGLFDL